MPETSLVIRTFNEEHSLGGLFEGLDGQGYRDFETIVVDSGSFDRTREIARKNTEKIIRIASHDFTFGHSLNVGIQNSTGRFIAIVSAHTVPLDKDWLGNLVEPLHDQQVAMVYGLQRGRADSKFSEYHDFERTFGVKRRVLKPPDFFANNANSAVRRDLWEQHQFDEVLPGLEDIEWAKYWMERNYLVVYQPTAGIFHIHRETWPQVRRRYYREAQAGKWIGIRGRRHIPSEIGREVAYFFSDLNKATRKGTLFDKVAEIARFRYEKAVGSVTGVWNGAYTNNPMKRVQYHFVRNCQAVVIHGPGRASLDTIDIPPLKPGEVLIRVAYEGICATDLEILEGRLGYYKSGMAKYPIVPGHEFSGTVVAVGARVEGAGEGDRVVVECIQGCGECVACRKGNAIGCVQRTEVGVIGKNGGYSEYVITASRFVHKLPPQLKLAQAFLCEPMAVVSKGIKRLQNHASVHGRNCAVIGAGTIGHMAARVLAANGYRTTVFDRNAKRLEALAGTEIRVSEELKNLDDFDSVVEATGNLSALNTVLANLAPGATLLLLGLPYGPMDFNFENIVSSDKTVIGSVGSGAQDFREAIATLPRIDVSAFSKAIFPLAEFSEAWQSARSGTQLKAVLCLDPAAEDEGR